MIKKFLIKAGKNSNGLPEEAEKRSNLSSPLSVPKRSRQAKENLSLAGSRNGGRKNSRAMRGRQPRLPGNCSGKENHAGRLPNSPWTRWRARPAFMIFPCPSE